MASERVFTLHHTGFPGRPLYRCSLCNESDINEDFMRAHVIGCQGWEHIPMDDQIAIMEKARKNCAN